MSGKFHIGASGPSVCSASVRPCPLGGEHFDTLAEAESAFQDTMLAEQGGFPTLRKNQEAGPVLPSEENIDGFLDSFDAGGVEFSVDLMDANPDIASQTAHGYFTVEVRRVQWEGEEVFVARADDGGDVEIDSLGDWVSLHSDPASARTAADEMVLDWKRNWGLA